MSSSKQRAPKARRGAEAMVKRRVPRMEGETSRGRLIEVIPAALRGWKSTAFLLLNVERKFDEILTLNWGGRAPNTFSRVSPSKLEGKSEELARGVGEHGRNPTIEFYQDLRYPPDQRGKPGSYIQSPNKTSYALVCSLPLYTTASCLSHTCFSG